MTKFRIGEGWDSHALVPGRALVLGGVTVPHALGLWGHSDADVLAHAIIDALLGAAGMGDIGRMFPDTDPNFKGADSMVLLSLVAQRLQQAGWTIGNLDCTIMAQAPKLSGHIPAMCQSLSKVLCLAPECVNVKAKTAENLGPVGNQHSMEARAIALIYVTA
jgi:2-C-methyl-D-erythritol 2,4-cyclodiphosphate synthase